MLENNHTNIIKAKVVMCVYVIVCVVFLLLHAVASKYIWMEFVTQIDYTPS